MGSGRPEQALSDPQATASLTDHSRGSLPRCRLPTGKAEVTLRAPSPSLYFSKAAQRGDRTSRGHTVSQHSAPGPEWMPPWLHGTHPQVQPLPGLTRWPPPSSMTPLRPRSIKPLGALHSVVVSSSAGSTPSPLLHLLQSHLVPGEVPSSVNTGQGQLYGVPSKLTTSLQRGSDAEWIQQGMEDEKMGE